MTVLNITNLSYDDHKYQPESIYSLLKLAYDVRYTYEISGSKDIIFNISEPIRLGVLGNYRERV